MNWVLGAVAIVVVIALLRQSTAPELRTPDEEPKSILDHFAPLVAGGATSTAGPSINPTGGASVMITYDKV
jgi:hypothetical protein